MALNKPLNMARGNNTSTPPSDLGEAGTLHWLQPNSDAYDQSQLVWKNVDNSVTGQLPVSSNSTSGGDWFVGLDGWLVASGNNHITNTETVVATVDPLYSEMYLPQNEARLIRMFLHICVFYPCVGIAHTRLQTTLFRAQLFALTFLPSVRSRRPGQFHAMQPSALGLSLVLRPSRLTRARCLSSSRMVVVSVALKDGQMLRRLSTFSAPDF